MKTYLLLFCSFLLIQDAYSQTVSEAEQNKAVQDIQQSQSLMLGLRQSQQNYNSIALDRQKTAQQQQSEQKQLLAVASEQIKKYGALPTLKDDKGLKNNTLAYAKILEEVLTKDLEQTYIKAAEAEVKCSKCLLALKRAYELQKEDLKRSDVFTEKISKSIDDIAAAYNIEIGETLEDKKGDEIRANADFVMMTGFVVGSASQAHNELAMALQNVFAKKLSVADFKAMEPNYTQIIKESTSFFNNNIDKNFAAGATLYKSCETMLRQFNHISDKVLPEINLLLGKEKLTDEEKKKAEQLIKDFNAVAPSSKLCKNEMLKLIEN